MVKPSWGKKRICPSCDTRFYDLNAETIKCPGCGGKINPDEIWRSSRAAIAKSGSKKKKSGAAADEMNDIFTGDGGDDFALSPVETKEEGLDILEDASDLSDDKSDVADVIRDIDND